jgi:serine/threonine-protein kinase
MEYIEGVRFNDLLRSGPLEPMRALRLIVQVCDALRYAHEHKVIHRDIKHSNVLVRNRNGVEQVKVVDFGIAKMMEDETGLTLTGVVLGSPHFMAPEQARGSTLSHQVDIYAVGVLLYCSLVGRYPFNGDSFHKIVFGHLGKEVPTFQEANPAVQINPNLEAIVRRCLAKEPTQRFPDVDDLLRTLSWFLEEDDEESLELDPVTAEHLPPHQPGVASPQNTPAVASAPASAPASASASAPASAPASASASAPASASASASASALAGSGGLPWWLLPLGIGLVSFMLTTAVLVVAVLVMLWR